jgi:AraC family transcriptional regulator of adaptative response / DNA-3-methyladenine glycosylase II
MAVRAVLGQQVSVRAATTLSGRLVRAFGSPVEHTVPSIAKLFPAAETLAGAPLHRLRAIGLPGARAQTLRELGKAVAGGELVLSPGLDDPDAAIARLLAVPGIGPWTAHYLAMRALRWPDAFPAGDLVLHKALDVRTARRAEDRARAWQPWRAYAAMHLWTSHAQGG